VLDVEASYTVAGVIVRTPDPFVVTEFTLFDAPPVVVLTTRVTTSYAVELPNPLMVNVSPPEAACPKYQSSSPVSRKARMSKSFEDALLTVIVIGLATGTVVLKDALYTVTADRSMSTVGEYA